MREILARIEAIDASVHIVRHGIGDRFGKKPWMAFIRGERDGLKIETKAFYGATPDEALAAAWSLFAPAEKLVEPTMLPAPSKMPDGIEDADYTPLKDENGDDFPF